MQKASLSLLLLLIASFRSSSAALETWTEVPSANGAYANPFQAITFGRGLFVAVGYQPKYPTTGGIIANGHGLDWTDHHILYPTDFHGVAFGNGTFVAVGVDMGVSAGRIWFSSFYVPDDLAWTFVRTGVLGELYGVTYGKGIFVAVGFDSTNQTGVVVCSEDGRIWGEQIPVTSNLLNAVAYGNGRFVAVGGKYFGASSNSVVLTSCDGTNWTIQPSGVAHPLQNVTFINGNFYVCDGTNILRTESGCIWTTINVSPCIAHSVAYGDGALVAVCSDGKLLSSADGLDWKVHESSINRDLTAIAYGNHTFVVTALNRVFVSGNTGLRLSARNQQNQLELTLAGGISSSWRLQSSTDLENWYDQFTFTNIDASAQFCDTNVVECPQRFYRAVSP